MELAPTRDDVARARTTPAARLHRTPTFSSRTLSELTGANVLLKAELLQRTGSFKPRGVFTKLASLSPAEKARPLKIAATREYGATVDTEAAAPGEAFDRLEDLIAETGRTLVHPFDDP